MPLHKLSLLSSCLTSTLLLDGRGYMHNTGHRPTTHTPCDDCIGPFKNATGQLQPWKRIALQPNPMGHSKKRDLTKSKTVGSAQASHSQQ
jgi:hypothetical protein